MALIRYSPLVNDIRGSIGNGTFQRCGAVNVVRNKPVPIVRESQYTTNVRSAIVTAEYAWRALSDAQRLQWNNFCKYSPDFQWRNPKVILSGYQLFLKYNTLRILRGHSVLQDVVFKEAPYFPIGGGPYLLATVLYLALGQSVSDADWYWQLRMSRPCGAANSSALKDLRIIAHTEGTAQVYNIASQYYNVWAVNPAAGQWLWSEVTFFHAAMPFVYSKTQDLTQLS